MLELFHKIPVSLPKPVGYIKKRKMLLTNIGGKWFIDKHKSKIPPIKIPIRSKEENNKEDYIQKTNLKTHQHWNYWRFRIHSNELEWVVPKSLNLKKNLFCISSHRFYFKDKNPKNRWVGHSLMKPMYVDELLNRMFIVSELEAGLNDDAAIDTSGIIEGQP